ncbi:helicase associated domain-containing protein [Pseudarthrobacter sp. AB1]|uniref:helicase associated domain-containing protein n=1 Tax=Pseudarthrobacter sp. AB1 TaxID=2138309 RepID=UPI00186BAC3F|nr:helicase associated domain-containing protein [Pseudarthrobacter sp. AB1]MBE4719545.1 helicase-associated protein [Pseudarthrobacter sp. AB1]
MTIKHRAAPDPEWVLMYRQGITSPRIAATVGAAESTVRYHLTLATKADPGLRGAHKSAAGKTTRRTAAGAQNLADVVAFHQVEGRQPTTGGRTARERALGVWLHRRRQEAADGTLSPAYRAALSILPGWDTVPRPADRNNARWDQRLAELVEYRAAGNDWPLHKKAATEQERVLGVWLHGQRIDYRTGKIKPAREEQLNESLPGWREGRKRSGGRRKA